MENMFAKLGYRGRDDALPDNVEELGMRDRNLCKPSFAGIVLDRGDTKLRANGLIDAAEQRVPRVLTQCFVEPHVLLDNLSHIIDLTRLGHRGDRSIQCFEGFWRSVLDK